MEIILDVQGFISPHNNFVPKELAVIGLDDASDPTFARLLFKPPCAWSSLPNSIRATNAWLTRNYHGLDWNRGDIPFNDMPAAIKKLVEPASYILVKGPEKKKWLDGVLYDVDKPVVDLETLNCPNLNTLRDIEVPHWHGDDHGYLTSYSCAFQNVQRLKQWYLNNCSPSLEKSVAIYLQVGSLELLKAEDVAVLDKDVVLLFADKTIDEVWEKLPEDIQMDEEVASHRRCKQHYCSTNGDQFDESIPMIKDFIQCQRAK